MSHFSHDEFVLTYYGEPGLADGRRAHLDSCDACRTELSNHAALLDRVTPVEVPDPGDDYEARVWDRLQWRLRGEKKQRPWMAWAAIAATVVVAFVAGLLWKSGRSIDKPGIIATGTTPANPAPAKPSATGDATRVLLVVVGEHFDQSERVLVELANLTPDGKTDISGARDRAQDLLASNRLYRSSASRTGEEDVATLLDELEPVLLQLAHAPSEVSAEELRSMQKRVEAKGLVFKLRVVRADVQNDTRITPSTSI
jgi:hypothetical protein